MTTKHTAHHSPPRFSEYQPERQNKSARQIQAEIDLMRLAYIDRMLADQPRRDAMIGWCLVSIALVVPAIAALALIIL